MEELTTIEQIKFKTEEGRVLVEVEAKETWTEEELHELLNNK
jgi:leucyl aminopeptidase (aminopeptidase T)